MHKPKEPKFGHLRDLHNVIRSYEKTFLLWGKQSFEKLVIDMRLGTTSIISAPENLFLLNSFL
jgi:hypothetical protein